MSGESPGPEPARTLAQERGTRLVLIAEDEEPIAEALAYLAREAGYRVIVAAQGRIALELARAHRPDLIITDLMMPQMSGTEFIQALRDSAHSDSSQDALPPIVLMTAAGPRYADAAGADAILLKPFDLEQVEALLRRFLAEP